MRSVMATVVVIVGVSTLSDCGGASLVKSRKEASPVATVRADATLTTLVEGTRIRLMVPSFVTGVPESGRKDVVRVGGWQASACPPEHCYALTAVGTGTTQVIASDPGGCTPNGTCYVGKEALEWFHIISGGK